MYDNEVCVATLGPKNILVGKRREHEQLNFSNGVPCHNIALETAGLHTHHTTHPSADIRLTRCQSRRIRKQLGF